MKNKTKKFEVKIEDCEDPDDCFIYNILKVIRNGKVILNERDCGEPEDNRFYRDWNWVEKIIRIAYKFGLKDGRKSQQKE